jgi:hypothetical protein
MIAADRTVYRCAPAIIWVKDARQTILVAEDTGSSWTLCGVEAAIWDLLALNYPAEQIARFLSALLAISPQQAAAALSSALQSWAQVGILISTPLVAAPSPAPPAVAISVAPEGAHG